MHVSPSTAGLAGLYQLMLFNPNTGFQQVKGLQLRHRKQNVVTFHKTLTL